MVYLSMIHTKMSNVVTGFDWIWMCLARFIEPRMGRKISIPLRAVLHSTSY
jgi:hypothetical protein